VNFDYQSAFGELVMLNPKKSDNQHRKAEAQIPEKVDIATMIFKEHGDMIRTIIRYFVSDVSKADDIYQDFFLSIVHKPVPLGIQDLRGYLYRAIMNDIRDRARRAEGYQARIRKYAEFRKYSVIEEQAQVIVARDEEHQKMVQLIERQLPHYEAEAIILRYCHDKNIRDAAEKMRVNKRTFSVYLCGGLKKIRRFVREKQITAK
jgi:RNA polymerase sigma factor (sigma-70 family)